MTVQTLFDSYGMPEGNFGKTLYADLVLRLYERLPRATEHAGIDVFDVLSPQATRGMLVRAGTDLNELDPDALDEDSALIGLAVQEHQGLTRDAADLWGLPLAARAGALIVARYGRHGQTTPTGAEHALRDIVLVARSGARAVLKPAESGPEVSSALANDGDFHEQTGIISLMERVVQCSAPTPETQHARSMTVGEFAASEVLAATASAAHAAAVQRVPDSELPARLLAVAMAQVIRVAVVFALGLPDERAHALRQLRHELSNPHSAVPDTDLLTKAFRQCQQTLRQTWVEALTRPEVSAALSGVLPREVLRDPSWGGSRLVGLIVAGTDRFTQARHDHDSIPNSARPLISELMHHTGAEIAFTLD